MKRFLIATGVSVLVLACVGPATAQQVELAPQMTVWEPVIGKWVGEQETRESPTASWTTGSVEWEIFSRGYYLELQWKDNAGSQEILGVEIVGYDPLQKSYVSHAFRSNGSRGGVTSMGWDGQNINLLFTNISEAGEVRSNRTVWEYTPDFKSVTGTGEVLSDGKWWVQWKVKADKVD